MEWFGATVLTIYREKHRTYVSRIGLDFPPVCKGIGDYWTMNESVLASRRDETKQRCSDSRFPSFQSFPCFFKTRQRGQVFFRLLQVCFRPGFGSKGRSTSSDHRIRR